jgi:PDZ domain-containing secreted protein
VAGLETGDEVLAIDGQEFKQISEIQSYVAIKEN